MFRTPRTVYLFLLECHPLFFVSHIIFLYHVPPEKVKKETMANFSEMYMKRFRIVKVDVRLSVWCVNTVCGVYIQCVVCA